MGRSLEETSGSVPVEHESLKILKEKIFVFVQKTLNGISATKLETGSEIKDHSQEYLQAGPSP